LYGLVYYAFDWGSGYSANNLIHDYSSSSSSKFKKKERRQLPHCVCAKIRQIFPSAYGYYMGFEEI
jgi:hypothetical protein